MNLLPVCSDPRSAAERSTPPGLTYCWALQARISSGQGRSCDWFRGLTPTPSDRIPPRPDTGSCIERPSSSSACGSDDRVGHHHDRGSTFGSDLLVFLKPALYFSPSPASFIQHLLGDIGYTAHHSGWQANHISSYFNDLSSWSAYLVRDFTQHRGGHASG